VVVVILNAIAADRDGSRFQRDVLSFRRKHERAGEEPIMNTFSYVIFATLLWPAAASAQ
jgi:hypothetical protein